MNDFFFLLRIFINFLQWVWADYIRKTKRPMETYIKYVSVSKQEFMCRLLYFIDWLLLSSSPPKPLLPPGVCCFRQFPLAVAPDRAGDYFCGCTMTQGTMQDGCSRTNTVFWTQGRNFSFYTCSHSTELISKVTSCYWGAIKEQKWRPKKLFQSTLCYLFCAQKCQEADRRKTKSKNKSKHCQAFREKARENFPKGQMPLENIWHALCILRDKVSELIA